MKAQILQPEAPAKRKRHKRAAAAAFAEKTEWKDPEREKTIESMLPLVHHIVSRMALYLPPHLSREDLVSAGVIGLIDAVDRYDPKKGTALKTYCSLRIRGSILDELRRLDWVPRSVHREARELQKAQDAAAQKVGREPTEEEIRNEMGLDSEEFAQLLARIRPTSYFSLQEPIYDNGDGDALTHEEILADNRAQDAVEVVLHEEDKKIVKEQLQNLPLAQMQVLTLYYMENLRLKEIAEILDLTESRVSQIHTMAVSRLRSSFKRERKR